jgi:hypothetical protein
MIELIKSKWTKFAKKIFFMRFFITVIYLLIFSASVVHRQSQTLLEIERFEAYDHKYAEYVSLLKTAQSYNHHEHHPHQHIVDEDSVVHPHLQDVKTHAKENDTLSSIRMTATISDHDISLPAPPAAPASPGMRLYEMGMLRGFLTFLYELLTTHPNKWWKVLCFYPVLLYTGELIIILGVVYKLNNELQELISRGPSAYFGSAGSAFFENVLSLSYSLIMVLVFICSFFDLQITRALIAIASLVGWCYMFFFLLAFRMTGPMIVMIFRMLTSDVKRFLIIFSVFLMAFSQAFYVLFHGDGLMGLLASIRSCSLAMLGDFDFDDYAQQTHFVVMAMILLILYVVVITILLLNLLIAMMGNSKAVNTTYHVMRQRRDDSSLSKCRRHTLIFILSSFSLCSDLFFSCDLSSSSSSVSFSL